MFAQRIERIQAKLERYHNEFGKDHPNTKVMLGEIAKYTKMIETGDRGGVGMGPDRMHNRVEKLVHGIRKAREFLESDPPAAVKKRTLARIEEYQTSLKNIQEFGSERKPSGLESGVKIEVPIDVLSSGE